MLFLANNIVGDNMNYKIKELPKKERPRERLLSDGADKLSNDELISIILKTGTVDKSVKDISIEVLRMYEDITNLYLVFLN